MPIPEGGLTPFKTLLWRNCKELAEVNAICLCTVIYMEFGSDKIRLIRRPLPLFFVVFPLLIILELVFFSVLTRWAESRTGARSVPQQLKIETHLILSLILGVVALVTWNTSEKNFVSVMFGSLGIVYLLKGFLLHFEQRRPKPLN